MANVVLDESVKDPYRRLAHAIVLRAVEDYRWARKKLKANPDHRSALEAADECYNFFLSQWFLSLSGLDGEVILEKLNKEDAA